MASGRSKQKSSDKTPVDGRAKKVSARKVPVTGNGRVPDVRALENLLHALIAAKNGDLSIRLSERQPGIMGKLAAAYNDVARIAGHRTKEFERISRTIGREGRLEARLRIGDQSGAWAASLTSINALIDDLVRPTAEVARVINAVAEGDLTQKMALKIEGQPVKGEFLRTGTTVNSMVDQLSSFASEVSRVAKEVGTEGKLGGQAKVKGVSGTWKDLTDNVNLMASNLTSQVRNIAQVTTAVAKGDLTQKITVDVEGEILELKNTINTMVDQLSSFADEVTRVAREVGTEGRLGGQADVKGVSGTWKDLTDNVNFMASNLTSQVRGIAKVVTAVATGDLNQKFVVEAKGEVAALADTINSMIDTLRVFAEQVTSVAREVGTEGILGGQAEVPGVAGTWKDLTDNVNFMASNLTAQVRDIAQVTTAVAGGDLSQKITVDVKGEILELKNTINTMVDQLSSFADEVTRVAREVGTEGRLGGQADVQGVSGTWKNLTDNVNFMASNLTDQVRNIAHVATAVARGDLSQKITVEAKGEVAALAETINKMTDTLRIFAKQVTAVAREVGTEGKLGGQAEVPDVAGTWKDLTDSVNVMASNLTDQVRNIAQVTTAVAKGDLTQKITVDVKGEILELKDTINTMVDQLSSFAEEVTRVSKEVGTDGKLGGQADVKGVSGTWKDLTDSVNFMAGNLTDQVRNIAQVATAVADGDLSQKITVDAKGEILKLKETINTMVDRLRSFAAEVTRVAREVGTEGKLGGQAEVQDVSGTWRGLTENVNFMASNLTDQVRNIAQVATAVAEGDLSQKITVDARGEILELKETINTMVDQLSSFAAEVTRVAREVGTDGKLGGQAEVEGVSGTWRKLTDNVNQLAANLTTQVRSIAEVSTAVTQGDLTRSIAVEAEGEVAELKDNINQMIANLRGTTQRNEEQDWLKTNLAKISGMLQGQRDLKTVSQMIMSEVTPTVSAQHGGFFLGVSEDDEPLELRLVASYAYERRGDVSNRFKVGEGLVGQAALEKETIVVAEAPGDYIKISSGLGESGPVNVVVIPILFEDQVLAVMELAAFRPFSEVHLSFLDQLTETLGVVLNTIMANMRTEELLQQSQSLAGELQSQSEELQTQQEELQRRNEELEDKAELLSKQNRDIEIKNSEIEMARQDLQRKAEQLALASKYKSEFLANMSHELRTPLNSLLVLAKVLTENRDGNLSEKQIEHAQTIHNAGSDLLSLIDDILDLSRVEAGKMEVHPAPLPLSSIRDYVERTFRPMAEEKGLRLSCEVASDAPEIITTDGQRLQQVLRNLLSNAVKFTHEGGVSVSIGSAPSGVQSSTETLAQADRVIAFRVTDTGIGMSQDQLAVIFEAFQQADGSTSRKYGGTGLGLSISREITRLLGGEIRAESAEREGSSFTLYLPDRYEGASSYPIVATMTAPVQELSAAADAAAVSSGFSEELLLLRAQLPDDRDSIEPGDRLILVVEGEAEKAAGVVKAGRSRGVKIVVAARGDAAGALASQFLPDAVILDMQISGTEGFAVLDQLKRRLDTRHIPVYVVSDSDLRHQAMKAGAAGYFSKALDGQTIGQIFEAVDEFLARRAREVLIVEDDGARRNSILELIGGEDIHTTGVASSEEALEKLGNSHFDCIVLDLSLPKMSGFQLLETLEGDPRHRDLPVIFYADKELKRAQETKLEQYAKTIIIKDGNSPDRLLEETCLYLHRPESSLAPDQRRMLQGLHGEDPVFAGKKVLVVDDDIRTVFALTSVLESRGMDVLFAETGKDAIRTLQDHPELDILLMDIMMPEMDGNEVTRRIRETAGFEELPIIALTAKAMKGDREASIAAGASDYITKPVDVNQLLSLLRVWLYHRS